MVKYDYTNMLSNPFLKTALSPDIIEKHASICKTAHAEILKDIENDVLGFYSLPEQNIDNIVSFAEKARQNFDTMVVLGIGGSALGNKALYTALKTSKKLDKELFVIDNPDPVFLFETLSKINLSKTIFNVITKSGTTAETMCLFMVIKDILEKEFGEDYKKHIVITTDAEKGFLRQLINTEGYTSFVVPDNVGGRFSVLTDVGLVSSAFIGIDIKQLLAGAKAMKERCLHSDIAKNPGYIKALLHYLYMHKGINIAVMMPYANSLYDFADWWRQLWAESLGKKVNNLNEEVFYGQTPVKALGTTDQHSQVQLYTEGPFDKVYTFIKVNKFAVDYTIPAVFTDREEVNYLCNKKISELLNTECLATEIAITKASRPNGCLEFDEINEFSLGEFIFLTEVETVFCGKLLNIDPLNQPGVEQGKIATYAMMGKKGYETESKSIEDYKSFKGSSNKIV